MLQIHVCLTHQTVKSKDQFVSTENTASSRASFCFSSVFEVKLSIVISLKACCWLTFEVMNTGGNNYYQIVLGTTHGAYCKNGQQWTMVSLERENLPPQTINSLHMKHRLDPSWNILAKCGTYTTRVRYQNWNMWRLLSLDLFFLNIDCLTSQLNFTLGRWTQQFKLLHIWSRTIGFQ